MKGENDGGGEKDEKTEGVGQMTNKKRGRGNKEGKMGEMMRRKTERRENAEQASKRLRRRTVQIIRSVSIRKTRWEALERRHGNGQAQNRSGESARS